MTKSQHIHGAARGSSLSGGVLPHILSATIILSAFTISLALHGCANISPESPADDGSKLGKLAIEVKAPGDVSYSSMDLFFFDDTSPYALDSYERTKYTYRYTATSTAGVKNIVALSGVKGDLYRWAGIRNFKDLKDTQMPLSGEDPENPVMRGTARINTRLQSSIKIDMRPLLAKVTLNNLTISFSDPGLKGRSLDSVRVYLTNVSATCSPLHTNSDRPTRYLCSGGFSPADTAGVGDMIYYEYKHILWSGTTHIGKTFYCYPNFPEKEGAGTPRTRLVVEGRLDGETWYYPIDIGGKDNPGICCGDYYVMDVVITRLGSQDPDIPISEGTAAVRTWVKDWDERENAIVMY